MEVGGLHRAAASLEILLDLYRLSLVELVPAARRAAALGLGIEATTTTPIPEPVTEVFGRLAASVQSRVPTSALPVISRGYHAEVEDAFEQLSAAGTLSQVVGPLKVLGRAMGRVCDTGDELVDLYSRQRPIQVKVLDPGAMLDDVSEALDEVAESERNILVLRNKHAALGDQLRAFERLEVTLGHALDLIAVAGEAGLHIGFEAQLGTAGFAAVVQRVRAQLQELERVVRQLEVKPRGVVGGLSALVIETKPGREAETHIRWELPTGESAPAVLRVYRRVDVKSLSRRLALAHECEGKSAVEAETLSATAVADMSDKPVLVAELPAGRTAYTDPLGEVPLVSPIYRVVAGSAFGVEGDGPETMALFAPATLEGPPLVWTRSLAPAPDQPEFYRDYDAVEVSWELPQNEVTGLPAAEREWAMSEKLPLVTGYRILRFAGGVPKVVTTLPAGASHYVDRVSADVLSAGLLRYTIEVLGTGNQTARPPAACTLSPPLSVDIVKALSLARRGLAVVGRPTTMEREIAAKLKDPADLKRAMTAFGARPEAERAQLLESWWHSVSEARRIAWLREWPSFVPEADRTVFAAGAAERLRARDLEKARIEIWLSRESPEVQAEVDRWWNLMDPPAREAATTLWMGRLDERQRRAVVDKRAKNGGAFDWQSLRPARVMAWWAARDPIEQGRLAAWWQELQPEVRLTATRDWLQNLSPEDQLSARWPDWQQLRPEEQQQLLDHAWSELPQGLYPEALAAVAWADLLKQGGSELDQVLLAEVGGLTRAWVQLRYATRATDLAVGFHLVSLKLTATALLVIGASWWILRRRRKRLRG